MEKKIKLALATEAFKDFDIKDIDSIYLLAGSLAYDKLIESNEEFINYEWIIKDEHTEEDYAYVVIIPTLRIFNYNTNST